MKLGWPYQLVLVLSPLVASVSSIGLFNHIAALGQLRTLAPGVSVEWSGYIIPVVQLLLALAVSVIGFLGVLLGTPAKARVAALTFCIGYALLVCSRWVPVAFGDAQFPGWLGAGISAAVVLALVGLAFALRSNNSFKPTPLRGAA